MDRFNPAKLGNWIIYCDICGKKCFASETVKLSNYTGRGGLIVCRADADKVDPGTIPFRINTEKNIPDARINHTDTNISAPFIDMEEMAYMWFLASSQDNIILSPSQDINSGLTVTWPI